MESSKVLTLNDALAVPAYEQRMTDWMTWLEIRYQGKEPKDQTQTAEVLRCHEHIDRLAARLNDLIMTVDGIRVVRAFITRLPPKSFLQRHELNSMKYYEYQYNSFLHRVHTVVELMKLVANEAFQVGLTPQKCKWDELLTSKAFARSRMSRVIDSCFNKLGPHIEKRHISSHRGMIEHDTMGYMDAELSTIERMRSTGRFEALPEEVKRYFHPVYMKWRLKNFKAELLKEVDDTEQIILSHLRDFLGSLDETERFPK